MTAITFPRSSYSTSLIPGGRPCWACSQRHVTNNNKYRKFVHANEAGKEDYHRDKRMIYWPQFLNTVRDAANFPCHLYKAI